MFPCRLPAGLGWPTLCVVCRRHGVLRICAPCVATYASTPPAPWTGGPAEQTPRTAERPLSALVAAVPFEFPWAGLVHAMKYGDRPELSRALAPLMVDALKRAIDPRDVDCLVPVPLAEARARQRGYNIPRELARHAAHDVGRPVADDWLLRSRDTPSQARLTREARLGNLAGAFEVPGRAAVQVRGRTVVLVDDVVTTGATLEAAAHALIRAGAASVIGWVLARTPAPSASHAA
jgi:ComF family protein